MHRSISARYQLLDLIGVGGMGAVYRAKDRLRGQLVALKQVRLPDDAPAGGEEEQSLRLALAHEFRVLAGLRHPHIISVLDYGFGADRQPFFTMELLVGAQDILEVGRGLGQAERIELLIQALEALAYLHRRGVIHHDLKPANILVANGRVRLLDFGLAVLAGQEHGDDAFGTLRYLAPEVLNGHPYTAAADLYSIGVVAYELLAGQSLYPTDDLTHFLDQALRGAIDLSPFAGQPTLAAAISALLAGEPAARPASAHRAIDLLGQVIGRATAADTYAIRESYLQAAAFVGRTEERSRLRTALGQALGGAGGGWLIGGESGVGKSRLLDELRIEAQVAGALVLTGQAVEDGGLAYQLWREPVRRLLLNTDLDDLQAGILKELVPDLARLLGHQVPDAPELPGEAGQQRLIMAVIELIQRQAQPLVLILEDLQWSSESLLLLHPLSRIAQQRPLLILASYRDDERPDLPQLLPHLQTMQLLRLSDAEIAALSRSMLGEAGAQQAVLGLLQRESEGNVFFLVEVVRALAETSGSLAQIGRMTLPTQVFAGSVQRIIRRRLDQVPRWGQPLLRLAAVLGRQLNLPVMEQARQLVADPRAEGPGSPPLGAWLNACADAAVLTVEGDRWQFAHDKLREALLADLGAAERPRLHRLAAQAITMAHPDDPAYAETLADHWYQAGAPEPTLAATVQAVGQLLDVVVDYGRAEALITRALALPGVAAAPQYPELIWQLGETFERRAHFAAADAQCRRCLDVIGDSHPKLQIQVLNSLCKVRGKQGDFSGAEAFARRALQIGEAIGDRKGMAIILNSLGIIAYRQGALHLAQSHLERSLAISQEINYRPGIGHCLLNLGNLMLSGDRYGEAADYYSEALRVSQAGGNRLDAASAITNLGLVANQQGRYAEAIAYYQESLRLDQEIGAPEGVLSDLISLSFAHTELGQPEAARPYLLEALEIGLRIAVPPYILEGLVCAAQLRIARGDGLGAAALIGLVEAHPATLDWTRAKSLPPLRIRLEQSLGLAALAEAETAGAALDLLAVARAVYDELGRQ